MTPRSMRLKARAQQKSIARSAPYSNTMNRLEETANASVNKDDLRKTSNDSLDAKRSDDYFTQKWTFLNNLRKSNVLCDVTLVSENDVEIHAHKVVLIGVSEFFFTKFTKYNEDRILLKDFNSSTLESLVNYAYTNDITIKNNNVEAILQAADYFCMEILKNFCANCLSSMINLPNCLHIRSIAYLHTCESLLNTCDDFIKKHFTEVIINEEFMNFPVDGLLKIIRDDDLNVPSESTVYTVVMKWIKYDLQKRQKHLYELMRHVRLEFLGRDRLNRISFLEPLFANISDMIHIRGVKRLFFDAFEGGNSLSNSSLAILDQSVPVPRVSYSSIPKLFVIGGSKSENIIDGEREIVSRRIVDCFDIRRTMWRSMPPMWHSMSQLSESVSAAQAVSTRNKIYITGSLKMQIFDMKVGTWIEKVDMPSHRRFHASVLLNNKIYVVGGTSEDLVPLASVEFYCLEENKWFNVPNMRQPRKLSAAAVLNGKIYVVGGSGSIKGAGCFDSVECYDPARSTWRYCKRMKYGRHGAAACAVDNLLYVVGGSDGGRFGDKFEVYNPVTNEWELMPDLPVPRKYHGVGYENGYLFVVGGEWDNTYISAIDVFCFVTRKWYKMGAGLSAPRSLAAVVMAYESPN